MIKVLAHGYPYKKYKCTWCGCEFEATDDELKIEPSIFSIHMEKRSIICPNCKTQISWDEVKRESKEDD